MGAAVRPVFIAAAGKTGAPRATEPTCRSDVRGDGSTSATGTSGADCSGRRRADRSSGIGAVAPVDGARCRNRGARDRQLKASIEQLKINQEQMTRDNE